MITTSIKRTKMAYNSIAVNQGCSYRTVFKNIVNLAEGKLKKRFPKLTREQRIILAQKEPLFSCCKQDRSPTKEEIEKVA